MSSNNNKFSDYAFNQVKKIDYLFYAIFKNSEFAEEIFTIYCFHLELSQIPVATDNPETRQIRSKWWLETIQNLDKTKANQTHPIVSLIKIYFAKNREVLKAFEQLIIIRSKENELHGFKTNQKLFTYIEKTNLVIWELIYKIMFQCTLTKEKNQIISNFSKAIKLTNIAESLYYRDYNNHFFVSDETISLHQNFNTLEKQEAIFKYFCKEAEILFSEINILFKKYKDLNSFSIYSKLNKSRLLLLMNCYKKNTVSTPPKINKFLTNICIFFSKL